MVHITWLDILIGLLTGELEIFFQNDSKRQKKKKKKKKISKNKRKTGGSNS